MIQFIEMFRGIGGFRYGLEAVEANDQKSGQYFPKQLRDRGCIGPIWNLQDLKTRDTGRDTNPSAEDCGETRRQNVERAVGHCLQSERACSKPLCQRYRENGRQRPYYQCVWSNDIDRYATAIYRYQYDAEAVPEDIRSVHVNRIPDHDLLTAGFPCPSFSVAGKRLGFEDTRGTLFYEICRVAEAKKPSLLLLENVRGLLSHDRGKTFATVLRALGDLGYWCEYQVLNSKYFGVPQNRERVFIIGHLRGRGGREIFPILAANEVDRRKTQEQKQRSVHGLEVSEALDANYWKGPDGKRTMILKQVGNVDTKGHNSIWGRVYNPEGVSSTLNAEGGGVGAKTGLYVVADRSRSYANKGRNLESPKSITNALSSVQKDNLVVEPVPIRYLNRNQKNFDKNAMTVDPTNTTGLRTGTRIRRLTPIECERLQAFPDQWTAQGLYAQNIEPISDTQRYKCLGNAVTTSVITFLGIQIAEMLHDPTEEIISRSN